MRYFVLMASVGCLGSGCDGDGVHGGGTDYRPESVAMAEATVNVGFALDREATHRTTRVAAYRLSRQPISVGEFRACVSAGACSAPELSKGACATPHRAVAPGATYSAEGAEDLPVTCASGRQAAQYCSWVGGRLPTMAQWLYAARGESVRRFPGAESMCSSHWRKSWSSGDACCETDCGTALRASIDRVPEHASVAGVMTFHGELVQPGSEPGECKSKEACFVSSGRPGAIDSVAAVESLQGRLATFRCAWTEAE